MVKKIKRRRKAEIIDFATAKQNRETKELILKSAREKGFEETLKLLIQGLLAGAKDGHPRESIGAFGWSLGILVKAGYLTESDALDLCEQMNLLKD